MSEQNVTYGDLFLARGQFEAFKQLGFPPLVFVKRVYPLITAVDGLMKPMTVQYEKLIVKHGQEVRPGAYEAKGAALLKVAAEFDPLLASQATLAIEPLTLDELGQAEGSLSEKMVSALWFLIDGVARPYTAEREENEQAGGDQKGASESGG